MKTARETRGAILHEIRHDMRQNSCNMLLVVRINWISLDDQADNSLKNSFKGPAPEVFVNQATCILSHTHIGEPGFFLEFAFGGWVTLLDAQFPIRIRGIEQQPA